jgi:predicted GNAT family N-acyltransferase
MKRPVHLSIGRIVLPQAMRGQERSFGDALANALQAGGGQPPASSVAETKAARTAQAIHQRIEAGERDG